MKRISLTVGIFLFMVNLAAAEPDRTQGLSMYLLSQQVGEINNQKWGFVTSGAFCKRYQKPTETFQSFPEILTFFRSLSRETQREGIWIAFTYPDAYSEMEKKVFESVRQGCLKEKIDLFVCQASKLPEGWIEGCAFSFQHNDKMNLAKDLFDLGWQSFKQGDLDTALKEFDRAVNTDPNFAPGYFSRAYIYSVQNKSELAIENDQKSVEKYPQYSHFCRNLGLDLLKSGKPNAAFAMLKKVIEIDPANGDAHVNMARYYFEMKDYTNCWKHIVLAEKRKAKIDPLFLGGLAAKMPRP